MPAEISEASGGSIGSDGRAVDVVTVCAWCPELHVMRIARRLGDVVAFITNEEGKLELCYRKTAGQPVVRLTISHSICDECRRKVSA